MGNPPFSVQLAKLTVHTVAEALPQTDFGSKSEFQQKQLLQLRTITFILLTFACTSISYAGKKQQTGISEHTVGGVSTPKL